MKIEFDPVKRDATLSARGLDMARCDEVFAAETLTFPDDRRDYGETRNLTVGLLDDRMVIVVWTERGGTRRIISLRKANDREKNTYGDRFGG